MAPSPQREIVDHFVPTLPFHLVDALPPSTWQDGFPVYGQLGPGGVEMLVSPVRVASVQDSIQSRRPGLEHVAVDDQLSRMQLEVLNG